jgi:putative Holliday junction resolvase
MRYLGLDLGSRTLGLAISDKTGFIATSYEILHHEENYKSLLKPLGEIIEKEHVEALVLGFPKNMNNTIGPKGELSLTFKKMLEDTFHLPVYLEDERLSTKSATNILIEGNMSRKKRKTKIDSVAATIILQSYLDRKGN